MSPSTCRTMKKLLVITGPTASGKTSCAIQLARQLDTEILSCDSRQFYRELRIGVARPSEEELAAAPHHFIACRSVTEPYNISDYERDALSLLDVLFRRHATTTPASTSATPCACSAPSRCAT